MWHADAQPHPSTAREDGGCGIFLRRLWSYPTASGMAWLRWPSRCELLQNRITVALKRWWWKRLYWLQFYGFDYNYRMRAIEHSVASFSVDDVWTAFLLLPYTTLTYDAHCSFIMFGATQTKYQRQEAHEQKYVRCSRYTLHNRRESCNSIFSFVILYKPQVGQAQLKRLAKYKISSAELL